MSVLRARSQRDHFAQHPQAITKETNFASFSVVPADRNFPNSQSCALCEIKQLDIECKTMHVRRLQNWPANIELKRLEPALGVPKWQTGCNAHKKVENTTPLLAPPRLMNANQTAVERARTERNVDFAICNWLDEFRRFCERRGEIRIRKEADRFSRRKQSGTHGRPLATIRKSFDQPRLDRCPIQLFASHRRRCVC